MAKIGKQLGSLDFVEDAAQLLTDSNMAFFLIVGTHTGGVTMASKLNEAELTTFKQWIESGHLGELAADHCSKFYPE